MFLLTLLKLRFSFCFGNYINIYIYCSLVISSTKILKYDLSFINCFHKETCVYEKVK